MKVGSMYRLTINFLILLVLSALWLPPFSEILLLKSFFRRVPAPRFSSGPVTSLYRSVLGYERAHSAKWSTCLEASQQPQIHQQELPSVQAHNPAIIRGYFPACLHIDLWVLKKSVQRASGILSQESLGNCHKRCGLPVVG